MALQPAPVWKQVRSSCCCGSGGKATGLSAARAEKAASITTHSECVRRNIEAGRMNRSGHSPSIAIEDKDEHQLSVLLIGVHRCSSVVAGKTAGVSGAGARFGKRACVVLASGLALE